MLYFTLYCQSQHNQSSSFSCRALQGQILQNSAGPGSLKIHFHESTIYFTYFFIFPDQYSHCYLGYFMLVKLDLFQNKTPFRPIESGGESGKDQRKSFKIKQNFRFRFRFCSVWMNLKTYLPLRIRSMYIARNVGIRTDDWVTWLFHSLRFPWLYSLRSLTNVQLVFDCLYLAFRTPTWHHYVSSDFWNTSIK